jgi:hypothetical protein
MATLVLSAQKLKSMLLQWKWFPYYKKGELIETKVPLAKIADVLKPYLA